MLEHSHMHTRTHAHIYNFIKCKLKHVSRMVVTVPSFEIYGFIIQSNLQAKLETADKNCRVCFADYHRNKFRALNRI